MKIDSREVHIWFADLKGEANYNALTEILSEDEYERSCLFAFPHLKNRFILTRTNLRFILSCYINQPAKGIKFCYGEYGKPELAENKKVRFNLSHSGDWAVYAISLEDEVGIDIEQIRSNIYSIDMEQLCLSMREKIALAALSSAQRMQTIYSLWTYKEALVKGLGCGLQYPLTGLEIDISNELKPKVISQNLNDWNLHPLRCPQSFKGALAIKRQNVRLIFKELKG